MQLGGRRFKFADFCLLIFSERTSAPQFRCRAKGHAETLVVYSVRAPDMSTITITPFNHRYFDAVLELTIEAWTPVFELTKQQVPRFVYDSFYPEGWQKRQSDDVANLLNREPENIWLALQYQTLVGYLGIRLHPEDDMGEIYIIAVSPSYQRQGIGRQLMEFASSRFRASGMKMMMVETIGDKGHAAARAAYEDFGFQTWPVARYFKPL